MLAAFSAVPGRLFSPFNETLDLASDTGDTLELLHYPNGARALACLTQKSGSTEWKRLILMAITGERADNPHIFHGFLAANGKSDAVEVASADEVAQPTSEYEDVVKFIIVRDPYERLLSAYLDKVAPFAPGENAPGTRYPDGMDLDHVAATSFPDFVGLLLDADPAEVDPHFAPIVDGWRFCLDAHPEVLKYENQSAWYARVVSELGLEEAAAHGWEGAGGCYFRPCDVECGAALQDPATFEQQCTPSNRMWVTHTGDVFDDYYDTADIFGKVTALMRRDLHAFGYPERRLAPNANAPSEHRRHNRRARRTGTAAAKQRAPVPSVLAASQ